jgi:predicted helicase
MSTGKTIKPADKAIKTYYEALQAYQRQDVEHETAVRSAFQNLLEIDEFRQRVPDLALGLVEKIKAAHRDNAKFIQAFDDFYELCRNSLNPNLSQAAVDEMLVQHLLTEQLIRTIFDNQDFTRRNVIAAEVEKVIDALVSQSFNRHDFLKSLDRFYLAIEQAAATIESFAEKQHFLNTVYERFFQGYSVKVADTHGIVYTPQEIVDFMCASVEEVLRSEFGKTLGDEGVHILDPCTGTGNSLVNLLRRIPKRDLPRMYRQQLFANEVMLLPYYIAALNVEHAYYELTGGYEAFPGLCFVDTLELAKGKQTTFGFMTEENVERVRRQTEAPITVVIGKLEPWPLEWIETPGVPLSYHVEKMRLAKDKQSIKVNDSLTLAGIPLEAFDYRLGNRSALEWILDQYQVFQDKRSGIRSDPNRADDPQYIVRLIGQVARVSVETVATVKGLPVEFGGGKR